LVGMVLHLHWFGYWLGWLLLLCFMGGNAKVFSNC